MCVHDFLHDGESQASSSAGTAAVVVETREAFEYAFAVLGGDFSSVVVDDKRDGADVRLDCDSYGRVSVPFGVVEQVPYEAFALGSVAGNPSAGDIGQIDVHSASVADGLGGGQDEFVDIDGMAVLAEFVLVGFE
jgi:hypothetical protein